MEKTLMLGKTEGRRRRGQQRTRWLDGITNSMDMSFSMLREIVKNKKGWHAAIHQTRLNNNNKKGRHATLHCSHPHSRLTVNSKPICKRKTDHK